MEGRGGRRKWEVYESERVAGGKGGCKSRERRKIGGG